MQNQPGTFRFSLRAMFICTAFVALGVLALMHASPWVELVLALVVVLLFAYSIVAVLATTGSRRLFWAAFAATAFMLCFGVKELPDQCVGWLWDVLYPNTEPWAVSFPSLDDLRNVATRLFHLVVSTAAAYILPWLVQRGRQPPQA
jgi:hypothetical protein